MINTMNNNIITLFNIVMWFSLHYAADEDDFFVGGDSYDPGVYKRHRSYCEERNGESPKSPILHEKKDVARKIEPSKIAEIGLKPSMVKGKKKGLLSSKSFSKKSKHVKRIHPKK